MALESSAIWIWLVVVIFERQPEQLREISNYKFMHGWVQYFFKCRPTPPPPFSAFISGIALIVQNVSAKNTTQEMKIKIDQWNMKLRSHQMISVRQNLLNAYISLEIDQNTKNPTFNTVPCKYYQIRWH